MMDDEKLFEEYPEAKPIYDAWDRFGKIATFEEKNRLGEIFLEHVLGLTSEELARLGRSGGHVSNLAFQEVSRRMNCKGPFPGQDFKAFWRVVVTAFPSLHTEAELEYILKTDPESAARNFRFHVSNAAEEGNLLATIGHASFAGK